MKYGCMAQDQCKQGSPPSRGAWIEIQKSLSTDIDANRRPPRGGRGLKFFLPVCQPRSHCVAPLAGGVD